MGERFMLFEELLEMERRQTQLKDRAEMVLEFLEELGPVPKELKEVISSEENPEILKEWIKMAAHANSIEEFEQNISNGSQFSI